MASYTLITKATRLCNLRCSYCHDWAVGPGQRMELDVLSALIGGVLSDRDAQHVTFIWHGGEPTVLPLSFYQRALYLQGRYRRPGQTIVNGLQTNGTRLSETWLRFLRDNGFLVGISLDGPRELHEKQRPLANGRSSYDSALAGLRSLERAKIPHGVSFVVDQAALALGGASIFDWFAELEIRRYSLLAAKPPAGLKAGQIPAHYVSPSEMCLFLGQVWTRWNETQDHGIRIRELDDIRRRLAGRRATNCTMRGGCLGHYFLIEPNGEVAHCDLFRGDRRYTLGNVLSHSLHSIIDSPQLAALKESRATELASKSTCPWYRICQGGCPHDHYMASRHAPNEDPTCCGLRPLIETISSPSA